MTTAWRSIRRAQSYGIGVHQADRFGFESGFAGAPFEARYRHPGYRKAFKARWDRGAALRAKFLQSRRPHKLRCIKREDCFCNADRATRCGNQRIDNAATHELRHGSEWARRA